MMFAFEDSDYSEVEAKEEAATGWERSHSTLRFGSPKWPIGLPTKPNWKYLDTPLQWPNA